MNDFTMQVSLKSDEKDFFGRECPKCQNYFKVKFKDKDEMMTGELFCPYCKAKDVSKNFFTQDQADYIKSLVWKEVAPILTKSLNKGSKQSSRRGLISLSFSVKTSSIRIKEYQEKELETEVNCSHCHRDFSIYGVFSNCPFCNEITTTLKFEKNIEFNRKLLILGYSLEDKEKKREVMFSSFKNVTSQFNAIGKFLIKKYSSKLPNKRNLFQNYLALDKALNEFYNTSITQLLGEEDSKFLEKMYELRHIIEHNIGVIDEKFISVYPQYKSQEGRIYPLTKEEIEKYFDLIYKLNNEIHKLLSI